MRRTYILNETDILGVCISALFALPSVRAILPGAPDFGAISTWLSSFSFRANGVVQSI